jgi:hypothetical protein
MGFSGRHHFNALSASFREDVTAQLRAPRNLKRHLGSMQNRYREDPRARPRGDAPIQEPQGTYVPWIASPRDQKPGVAMTSLVRPDYILL